MTRDEIKHFLIVFDRTTLRAEVIRFATDGDAALIAYAAKEEELRGDNRYEVVLLGSDSLRTIKRTHSNYFPNGSPVKKYLELPAVS